VKKIGSAPVLVESAHVRRWHLFHSVLDMNLDWHVFSWKKQQNTAASGIFTLAERA